MAVGTNIHWYDYISRKFILALAAMVGAFYLAVTGKDTSGFSAALAVILGFYNGADVATSYYNAKAARGANEMSDRNERSDV